MSAHMPGRRWTTADAPLPAEVLSAVALRAQNAAIDRAAECIRWFAGEGLNSAAITRGDGHSGTGWYVHSTEYPEEGSLFLGTDAESVEVAQFIVGMERSAGLACHICGEPATCVGRYEEETAFSPACDVCCGHGNEDGHCEPVEVSE